MPPLLCPSCSSPVTDYPVADGPHDFRVMHKCTSCAKVWEPEDLKEAPKTSLANLCECCLEEGKEVEMIHVTQDAEGYKVEPFYACPQCPNRIDDTDCPFTHDDTHYVSQPTT